MQRKEEENMEGGGYEKIGENGLVEYKLFCKNVNALSDHERRYYHRKRIKKNVSVKYINNKLVERSKTFTDL